MEIRGRRKTDNKGSALVVVIIAMAFIGILASVLMYMSLLNYQMKVNNLKAKDNFYSAETVLDEIRSYMGTQISESVGNAYENVLQNYSSTSAEEKTSKLRYYFLTDMQSKYMLAGSWYLSGWRPGSGSMCTMLLSRGLRMDSLHDEIFRNRLSDS